MSIPLIQKPEKDDINTSIIAIKRNIERINMLLGLSNSEEIDTSEFVKKSDIVDEVAIGNMQSVTSNAVSVALSQKTINSWYVSVPPQEKVYFHRDVNTGSAYISRWIKLIINFHYSFGDSTSVSEYLLRLNFTPYNNQNYRGFTPALIIGITSQSAGNYDIINTLNLTWGWDDGGFYIVNTTDWATLNVTVISPFSKN